MIDKWKKTLNKSSYATADMQRTLSRVSSAIRSPMYPEYSKLQEKDSYFSKIREYEKSKRNLTTQEIEMLILSINNKKNTYTDLQECVPQLNSATLCSYLVNIPTLKQNDYRSCSFIAPPRSKPTYFQLAKEISDFVAPYEFKPTDTFTLSVTGENILYQLKKEQHMLELAEESLEQSKQSTKYSKYATYAAIASIVTGVLIAAIQFYLN
ncbi:hypothetical protein [uncultured Veillonella sp.]|uniref:hypothetical protein n=1 Tax=uncultured Veillonella sp. TaxID=159268 RepID=UPI0025975BF4|nr:hypothetical protein [uncultured Veillonella sp.]